MPWTMTAPKRPKLFERGESARSGARQPVRIPASCQVGDRPPEDVIVTDISAQGCKIRLVSIGVTRSEPIVLQFGSEQPITGRLTWIKQASLGVRFDEPVRDEVMARLMALLPDNVVPLRRTRLG
jgi:hypothetical protein